MPTAKRIFVIIFILILAIIIASLSYIISNREGSLVLLEATAEDKTYKPGQDLLAKSDAMKSDPITDIPSPTPTIKYKTISPTPSPNVNPKVKVISPTLTNTPTPIPTVTIKPSVTPIQELPVAGVADVIGPVLIGSVILVLVAIAL